MKYTFIVLSFIFILPIALQSNLIAQSDVTQSVKRAGQDRYQDLYYSQRLEIVITALKELKSGTLIIRLMSYDSKINHLRKLNRTKEADELQEKMDLINKNLMFEFEKAYDFSKVLYAYGKDLNLFLEDETIPCFVDENLALDKNIKLDDGPIYILAAQGKDNFYLYDKNMNRIPEPVPHAVYYKQKFDLSLDRILETVIGNPGVDPSVSYFNRKLHKILRNRDRRSRRY